MFTRNLRIFLILLFATALSLLGYFPASSRAQASFGGQTSGANVPSEVIGELFSQPVDASGKLLLSAWRDPDGSEFDQYVWDNFTLPVTGGITETITEINWVGGYDPLSNGAGGPVLDFSVAIYPSIAGSTEPAVANPPLAQYLAGGNAGQTPIGMVGGIAMYSYAYTLPAPLIVSTGVKYWVQVYAFQHGSLPDWGVSAGTGGDSIHYVKDKGAGGDVRYHFATNDAAFTVLGPIPDTPTDIMISAYWVNENQPANTIIGELTAADPDPLATFTYSLACTTPGADDGSFNILGTDLRTSAMLNYEARSSYHICIRVTDQNAHFFDKYFIISVDNVNEAPTDILLSNNAVDEIRPVNSLVGTLSASDPDSGATFTFSLTCAAPGVDDSSFNILGTSLRTSAVFNFDTKSTYNICMRVTDQGGLQYDKSFTIHVNDVTVIYVPIITR